MSQVLDFCSLNGSLGNNLVIIPVERRKKKKTLLVDCSYIISRFTCLNLYVAGFFMLNENNSV